MHHLLTEDDVNVPLLHIKEPAAGTAGELIRAARIRDVILNLISGKSSVII